jgi:hypothetical protein
LRQRLRMRKRLLKPWIQSVEGRLHRQQVIHFIHIGKTGGSAIKEAIRGDIRGVKSVYQDVAPGTRILTSSHHIDLGRTPPRDDVFFVLRDPVGRYISGFMSRLRQGKPRHDSPWSATERRAFERFPTPDDLAVALSSGDAETRAAAQAAMRDIRHVRSTFADWLGSPELLRKRRKHILLVGWQETLSDDFERLRGLVGLPDHCQLPSDPYRANRATEDRPPELSELGSANIREWYAGDYAIIDVLEEMGLTKRPGGAPKTTDDA